MTTTTTAAAQDSAGTARPWDLLGAAPHSPVRAAVAERLFRHAVRALPVRVALAGGDVLGAGGPDSPLMRVEDPKAFFHRLGVDAKIGFGESYMAGEWTSADPAELLTPFAARIATLVPAPLQRARRWVEARQPSTERGTVTGARENIHRHYDLSNDVFATFLDETMTYSAALFPPGGDDLGAAQVRKIDRILDLAAVGRDTELLEIGTGWGSLAARAARRGARVTTLTLSAEQQRLAQKSLAEDGLADRVEVRLADYREITGRFDAVVSVEMIEAVGREFWPDYVGALDRLVAPGGRIGLQAITMPHDRMLATDGAYTWIHKYIFPGGRLPSVEALEAAFDEHTGLRRTERHSFGPSYATTLQHWRQRFLERWDEVRALGFSERFRRTWEFYLAYSEAGFRSGYLDVWQLGYRKPAQG